MTGRSAATAWSVVTAGVGIALVAIAIIEFAITGAALAALTPGVVGLALCGLATLCPVGQRPTSLLLSFAVVLAGSCTIAVTVAIVGSAAALGVSHDHSRALVVTNVIMLALLVTSLAVCMHRQPRSSTAEVTTLASKRRAHHPGAPR